MGPLVLLSDSQLFFAQEYGGWMRERITDHIKGWQQLYGHSDCVYGGASNNNEPAFFDLAASALKGMGATDCSFLKFSIKDLPNVEQTRPAVILLAGGDVLLGWQTLSKPDVRNWLTECWHQGCLLLGVSAGAIHLTQMIGLSQDGQPALFDFLKFFPVATMVHEEKDAWPSYSIYQQYIADQKAHTPLPCLRIPFGGGVWITLTEQQPEWISFGRTQSELLMGADRIDLPYFP